MPPYALRDEWQGNRNWRSSVTIKVWARTSHHNKKRQDVPLGPGRECGSAVTLIPDFCFLQLYENTFLLLWAILVEETLSVAPRNKHRFLMRKWKRLLGHYVFSAAGCSLLGNDRNCRKSYILSLIFPKGSGFITGSSFIARSTGPPR